MKNHKRTEHQDNISNALKKVYDDLITYKIKVNSELVIIRDNKIMFLKPDELKTIKDNKK